MLPRASKLVLGRRDYYDGYGKLFPQHVLTFVPLKEYHVWEAALLWKPLNDHLVEYRKPYSAKYGCRCTGNVYRDKYSYLNERHQNYR